LIKKISICGKGGSGKSVFVTLIAKILSQKYDVLILDTDESNTGLYKMLNFENAPETISDSLGGRKNITKYWNENRLLDLIYDVIQRKKLITKNKIGLLSIGKILKGGEGCACPLNALVRAFLQVYKVGSNEILLLDTEAGVEHIGRGNEKYVDAIIIIVDPSFESLSLAKRVKDLSIRLGMADERIYVVTNKTDINTNKILINGLKERGLESNFIGAVRFDKKIQEASLLGLPIINYNGDVLYDIKKITDTIGLTD